MTSTTRRSIAARENASPTCVSMTPSGTGCDQAGGDQAGVQTSGQSALAARRYHLRPAVTRRCRRRALSLRRLCRWREGESRAEPGAAGNRGDRADLGQHACFMQTTPLQCCRKRACAAGGEARAPFARIDAVERIVLFRIRSGLRPRERISLGQPKIVCRSGTCRGRFGAEHPASVAEHQ